MRSFLTLTLSFMVLGAQAQLDGLPQFDTYHPVVPFSPDVGGVNTAEVLVHSFEDQELPSLVFLQTLDSNVYVAHQNEAFEWADFQTPTLPLLDYRSVEVWAGSDSLSTTEWYFMSTDTSANEQAVVVRVTDLLGEADSQIVLDSDIEFSSIHVEDMDDNGTPELITVKYGNDIPVLLWEMTDDGYVLSDTIGFSAYSSEAFSADLNGDDVLDVVTNGSPARVFVSQPDGSWNMNFSAPGLQDVVIEDFNGDGHLDFASIDYYGTTWTLAYNDGLGSFEPNTVVPLPDEAPLYGRSLDAADLNQDGAMDLLFTTATTDSIWVWRNGIDDLTEWVPVIPAGNVGARHISVVDLDQDGDLDWVGAGPYLHVSVLENHVDPGCTNAEACNYNDMALTDDGSCEFAEDYYDCNGACLNDADGDGVCDELEVDGCTDNSACNYDAVSTEDNGTCEFPGDPCDDGDETTINDVINDACECEGTTPDAVRESTIGFVVSPIPASDFLRMDVVEGEVSEVVVYNLAGQIVHSQPIAGSNVVDVRALPNGIYMLWATGNSRQLGTQRFVVQH